MSWNEITVLVDRAKTGDRESYGELVVRFQNSVYAMALSRVRDPLEAQELAQDVFVHAMRKLPQLRDARCLDRKSTRLNSSHPLKSRMPSSA